jgi:hypothetical protein
LGGVLIEPQPTIKRYPHFDSDISPARAKQFVENPVLVAKHAFYPFIEYEKRWTRFAGKGESGDKKCRVIRYAARRDACIFSHYRAILAEKYEARLQDAGISGCVLGYRRIPASSGLSQSKHYYLWKRLMPCGDG